jgi:hypothetical protein
MLEPSNPRFSNPDGANQLLQANHHDDERAPHAAGIIGLGLITDTTGATGDPDNANPAGRQA